MHAFQNTPIHTIFGRSAQEFVDISYNTLTATENSFFKLSLTKKFRLFNFSYVHTSFLWNQQVLEHPH